MNVRKSVRAFVRGAPTRFVHRTHKLENAAVDSRQEHALERLAAACLPDVAQYMANKGSNICRDTTGVEWKIHGSSLLDVLFD